MRLKGTEELRRLADKLSDLDVDEALKEAGEVFQSSHKQGFLLQKGPDGNQWARNPDWWREMKGHSSPLTGVTAGGGQFHTITRGRWKGFRIKRSEKQMKGVALEHRTGPGFIELFYPEDVEERARMTQFGGESTMRLHYPGSGDKFLQFNVNIQARPHLGFAERWSRLGSKTDPEHIVDIFAGKVSRILEGR